jgi:sec-independent protein translocase protein TatB
MNLSFSEMLFLFLLALIIFGPRKLPEIGRQVGKVLAEFRRANSEFKAQLETEMRKIEAEEAAGKMTIDKADMDVPVLKEAVVAPSAEPLAASGTPDSPAQLGLPLGNEVEVTPEAARTPNA